jgi:hypothetical protein
MQILAKARSHIAGNVIGYLALFIALGGTSYGLRTGVIDSREIRNNTVRTQDLRNNDIRSRDIRNRTIVGRDVLSNSLTGNQINEDRLDRVPLAARAESADDSLALGGRPAATFGTKPLTGNVDIAENGEGPVLSVPGFGTLAVTGCDPSASEVDLEFQSAANQDYWRTTVGLATPTDHEVLGAGTMADDFTLAFAQTGTIHLVRRTAPLGQAVIDFAFDSAEAGTLCRVAAMAISSD